MMNFSRKVIANSPYYCWLNFFNADLHCYCWLNILIITAYAGFGGQFQHVLIDAAETTRCPLLIPPANTVITYAPAGDLTDRSVATYSCLPGYERFGGPTRSCDRGRWTGQTAVCAINIAIRQNARQSSNATEFTILQGVRQAYEAAAYLGVDGTRIYCSKTQPELQPKWQLHFTASYPVVGVRIYGDVLRETNDLEVSLLSTDNFFGVPTVPADADPLSDSTDEREKSVCNRVSETLDDVVKSAVNENITFYLCNASFPARQVLIRRPAYASLRLCEVEVFSQQGTPCQHPGSPRNGIVKLSHVDWPFPPGAVAVYDCNPGYTRIPTEATYHRTCQINGTWDVREPVCVTNVAQYRLANQSSLFSSYNYPPWQAVDADLNSCAWTKRESEPWLQLDLLKPYTIHAVSLLLDKERLFYQFHRSLQFSITNQPSDPIRALNSSTAAFRRTTLRDVGPGSGVFYLDRPIIGQYITIFPARDTDKFLGICDIQVLAEDEIPATPDHCGLQTPAASLLYTFRNMCHQVQRFSATNWYNAKLACQDNGGSLLVQPTVDQHVFLSSVLSNLYRFHTSDDRYWISVKMSKTDNQWTFALQSASIHSSTLVENFFWASGRPINDGHTAEESCVALGRHGASNWSWADYRCDQDTANWICTYGPKSCGDPEQPEASALLVADKIVGATGWKIGDRVQYECAPGFVLTKGEVDSVCQADGTWSGATPVCHFVNCGDPPELRHTYWTLLNGTTFFGSSAQYFCLDLQKSLVVGSRAVGCLANGSWEWLDFPCDTHVLQNIVAATADDLTLLAAQAEAASTVSIHQAETVGVGVGVAVSAAILMLLLLYCGVRYRRQKATEQTIKASPPRKRHSPYTTIGRLQANQISGPIAVMQQPDITTTGQLKPQAVYDDLTPHLSTQASVSDESYSRSDPDGSFTTSNPSSTTYLQSFGKTGLLKLYQKAKTNGTLRMRDSDADSQRPRPRGPKLVISSPIECRKTVVLDSGTHRARTGTEVIYAQPAKLRAALPMTENQYEYLDTARVKGGFGSTQQLDRDDDDGMYADTTVRTTGRPADRHRSQLQPADELYDDVRAAPGTERYIRC